MTRLRRFWSNLCRVAAWAPLLWRDRDHDYAYLYTILAFKLRRMARHHRDHQLYTDWEETWTQLVVASWLAQRVATEEEPDDTQEALDRLAEVLRHQSRGWWC